MSTPTTSNPTDSPVVTSASHDPSLYHSPGSFAPSGSRRHLSTHPLIPFDPISESAEKPDDLHSPPNRASGFLGIVRQLYTTLSYLFGYKETWSLVLFIIFGGALVGFALARSFMLDPRASNYKNNLPPGEWYWGGRAPYRGALVTHVWTSFFIAWGAVLQFIPGIRNSRMILHRANGYGTLFLLPAGIASGWVVARRALGGLPVTQGLFYILGLLILISGSLGMLWVGDTRQHRKWMLRMSALLGVIITARLIMLAARAAITDIGTYYSVINCDEIRSLSGSVTNFSVCVEAQQAGKSLASAYAAVHASMNEAKINKAAAVRLAFPLGLWTAFIIHIVGIEIYIHLSERQNRHREGFVLTRRERREFDS